MLSNLLVVGFLCCLRPTTSFLLRPAAAASSNTAYHSARCTFLPSSSTTSRMASSAKEASEDDSRSPANMKHVQVLALHGSGGQAVNFAKGTLGHWKDHLWMENIDLEITAVQGHVPKDDGYAWWNLPPGLRSSTADHYEGFDESCQLVLDAFREKNNASESFDLIVGHSQGAILLTSLLALDKIERHPTAGYILNGVAWPNPYTKQLESLKISADKAPRVLVLVGETDVMNPPEQGERVTQALRDAGCDVTTVRHPHGHAVPVQRGETWDAIQAWIRVGLQ